jgi:hypothetical protein
VIFQTYHLPEQRDRCFVGPCYRPFDLAALGLDPWEQTQLCEYAAMRQVYREPALNPDPWVGFTSVNQRTRGVFADPAFLDDAFRSARCEAVVWGWDEFCDGAGAPMTLAAAAEKTHPDINAVMFELLPEGLPTAYLCETAGPFHNYWAMPNQRFREYMAWSLPAVERCLARHGEPFFEQWPRATAYIHERLFVCWAFAGGLKVGIVNQPYRVVVDSRSVIERLRETPGVG